MEKFDIADLWNEVKGMEEKQDLTKSFIQKMMRKSSQNEMNKILTLEILNLVVAVLILPLFIYTLLIAPDDKAFIVTMYAGLILAAGLLVWQVYKLVIINKVDFSKDPIINIAKVFGKLRLLLQKERIYQFFYFPFFLFVAFVSVVYLVKGQNFFETYKDYIWKIILAYILATLISLKIYSDIFKLISKTKDELNELKEFETE